MTFLSLSLQVHSKLRNGGSKGRGGRTTTSSSTSTTNSSTTTTASTSGSSNTSSNTPSPSPTAFLPPRPEKRKSKDECPSPVNGSGNGNSNSSLSGGNSGTTQSLVNPVTGLNVQISTKKCKTASPCAVSPVLLECPEQDCSKKYKHANGLRYHQSHAHGSVSSMDEDSSSQAPESPQRLNPPTSPSPGPTPIPSVTPSNLSQPQTPTKPPDVPATGLAPPLPSAASSMPIQPALAVPPASDAATPSPPVALQSQSQIAPATPLGSVVGGSITTGVAGQPVQSFVAPSSDQATPARPSDHLLKGKSHIYTLLYTVITTRT